MTTIVRYRPTEYEFDRGRCPEPVETVRRTLSAARAVSERGWATVVPMVESVARSG